MRRVNLHSVVGGYLVDTETESALFQTKLHDLVVEVSDDEVGLLVQADSIRTDLEFRSCPSVGVKTITSRDGEVESRFAPLILASRLERYFSFEIADAGGSSGRIVVREGSLGKK